jgi:signal transduction histidine kinase
MTFRTRLMLAFAVAVCATAILVSYAISSTTTAAFERLDDQQTRALAAQFQREFEWRSREVTRRLDAIASSEPVRHLAADLARTGADTAPYVDLASSLAREQDLDFLELLDRDASIISSAHYPARFGYRKEWVLERTDWKARGAFVDTEELPDSQPAALLAVRIVSPGDSPLYLIGGRRLDRDFFESIPLPPGIGVDLQLGSAGKGRSYSSAPPDLSYRIPLASRSKNLQATLVLSGSRPELSQLRSFLRWLGLAGAGAGLLAGLAVAWWASARVTRPVRSLAGGAREVAAGNWDARVEVASDDEIGELARAFNHMTFELAQQRDRLIQIERVAAWRELARRLAHELKNPLFPLQITVENLQRARLQHPEQFDEVFRESTGTLLAELASLKRIVAQFSDFAKLPAPRFERVPLARFIDSIVRVFEPQWKAPDQPRIQAAVTIESPAMTVEADPDLLGRALRNLILNAMDAMPDGGRIDLRAFAKGGAVIIEVGDTGAGLTPEECARLFTPYYTTKHHGTGLGLAIVQSVVSDHGGRISVSSNPGQGATFRLELPSTRNHDGPSPSY